MAYKEKDTKKWTAQWFETNVKGEKKKRRKRGFETKREALEYERQKKLNSNRNMNMKLSDFVDIYFDDKQNELKQRTIKNKRYMMEQHIIPYFGNQKINEITASQIIQWQNEMQTKGFSEAYLRMIQNQLTCLFSHASRIYDLSANPCKKVKSMGSFDVRSLNFWTKEEYDKFIQTIELGTRYYIIFEILFWTGCRIGEFLKQEIKCFIDRHYGMPDNERLFPIVQEAVQHKMKRHIEKSGVKYIRVHDTRHSHVAYLINKGVDPILIKERVGHKDIRITLNTYGHLYPSQQRKIADLIDSEKNKP